MTRPPKNTPSSAKARSADAARTTPPVKAPPPGAGGLVGVQCAAAETVGAVLTGKNLDRELAAVFARHRTLAANERAAVQSIAFDALRHLGLINAQLDILLSAPLTDAAVRSLLIVALAQLQFAKRAPHTIVDQAVDAATAMGVGRAKGLVNAVLRNYLRAPEKLARARFKDAVATYDFPRWWIDRLRAEQPDRWQQVLLSARPHPPMWLRVNARRGTAADYVARLAAAGISAHAAGAAAVRLERPIAVQELPGFAEGDASVQDIGAQLAAPFLDVRDGMRVLDACAAPGGKTGHVLECADADVVALDDDAMRLRRVSDNLARLRQSAQVAHADATQPGRWWNGAAFDRILLDVPCSGSGVVRRHPDIKWIRRQTDLARFAAVQGHLLAAVWKTLKVGGRLLYTTCSVFRAENQDVVDAFLKAEPTARRISLPAVDDPPRIVFAEDGLLLPDDLHDGFYFALLEKRG